MKRKADPLRNAVRRAVKEKPASHDLAPAETAETAEPAEPDEPAETAETAETAEPDEPAETAETAEPTISDKIVSAAESDIANRSMRVRKRKQKRSLDQRERNALDILLRRDWR